MARKYRGDCHYCGSEICKSSSTRCVVCHNQYVTHMRAEVDSKAEEIGLGMIAAESKRIRDGQLVILSESSPGRKPIYEMKIYKVPRD